MERIESQASLVVLKKTIILFFVILLVGSLDIVAKHRCHPLRRRCRINPKQIGNRNGPNRVPQIERAKIAGIVA